MDGTIDVIIYIVIQLIAISCAVFYWYQVFPQKEDRRVLFTGVFLYFICPYRLLYGFFAKSMWNAIGFSLLPLLLLSLEKHEDKKKKYLSMVGAFVCLVITGYTDFRLFLVFVCMGTILTVLQKKLFILPILAVSAVAVLPGNLSIIKYIFLNQEMAEVQLLSIMPAGYEISNLFRAFVIGQQKPGLGVGLFICLAVFLWNEFVRTPKNREEQTKAYGVAFLLLTLLSLKYCPWDYAQRVAGFMLRGVSYFAIPPLFFGAAQICLSVFGTRAICTFYKEEEKNAGFVLFLVLLVAGLGETMILLANIC